MTDHVADRPKPRVRKAPVTDPENVPTSIQTVPVDVVSEARTGFEHARKMLAVVDNTTKTLSQEEGELVAELDAIATGYTEKIEYLKALRVRLTASQEQGNNLADALDAYEKLMKA